MEFSGFTVPRLFVCLLLLVTGFEKCRGATKQWTQDVNFNNSANWDLGRVPCSQDTVIFHEKISVVFLQVNGTLREVILPNNGEVVLANTMTIGFSDDESIDTQCDGEDVTFTADTPKSWFDPDNWEDPEGPVTVETELVPCQHDHVTFPEDNLYYVALNQSISVGTINVAGKDYTHQELIDYLQSPRGKLQFAVDEGKTIQIMGYKCPDTTGCMCGNDLEPQTKDMICSMLTCYPVTCGSPVTPEGGCCAKCGAVLTIEYEDNFNMDQFKQTIKTTYGGAVNMNKRATKRQADISPEIIFYISKTKSEKIQLVITDRETGSSSGRLAVEMAQRIRRDMQNDMASFKITSVSMQSSSKGTGGRFGVSGNLTGGSIAGIIVVICVVLGLTGTAAFIYFRRVSFRKDDPLHADIEMTPTHLPAEYVQEIPIDTSTAKGFANPVYATTPTKDVKPMYADPTKADTQANGQQSNGHQVNGHQPKGSLEKNSYDHESAANGLENMEQRDSTIVGLAFTNPMSSKTDDTKT